MSARFQYLRRDQGWVWRLLGANNRAIARSPEPCPDAIRARRDASTIARLAADGRIEVIGDGRGWRWVLLEDATIRAVSAGTFVRRSDCRRAVSRFRASAVTARLESPDPLV